MKTVITFKHNDSSAWPCIASTYLPGGDYVCQVAKTWDEAERLLIDIIKARIAAGAVPTPKEVEVQ